MTGPKSLEAQLAEKVVDLEWAAWSQTDIGDAEFLALATVLAGPAVDYAEAFEKDPLGRDAVIDTALLLKAVVNALEPRS